MDHLPLSPGILHREWSEGPMYVPAVPSYPPTSLRARRARDDMQHGGSPVERGKVSVKRQTLILVVIGVILFIAGSTIAFASVKGASKKTGSNVNVAPVTTSVVVANANIPAGT